MNRTVNATTPLGAELKFKSLKGYEALSGLFEWTIEFVSESHRLDLRAMLGKPVSLEVETTGAPRYLHGLVTAFRLVHRETATPRYYLYEATVRPWLWYATQTSNNRIFQEQTAPGMMTRILEEYGYAVDNRLVGSYREWGYCVQFQETDFNFISRLMEHEGIYYWFRHEKTRHVLVLMDDAHSHEALNGMPEIPFYPDDRLTAPQQDCISDWQIAGELTPTTYSTMDYDFQKPQADMSAKRWIKRQNTQGLDLEWYDPMGGYVDSAESEHYARVHLESLQCLQEQAWASGNVRDLAPGYTFSLKHYPNRAENKAYLIVRAEYDIGVQAYASTDQPADQAHFSIRSQQIPATVQFRASRVTPVPKMSGPQTATVVGPEGEEIWTDKYGRIKVQFHWDRQGKMNEDSSCWVRVSNPWAGGGFGGVQIPRVREEVVVDFINGDVDRPIAVGRVYNASNMPPVNLPDDATQSGFLTRSKNGTPENANKLMFEDRQGSERLSMVAEKDMNTHVKNNQSHDVVGNVVSGIAGLRSHTAHSTSDITMSSGAIKSYLADHNRTVQASLEDSIGGNLEQILSDGVDETITGSFEHTVGGPASHEVLGLHVDTTAQDDETVDGTVDETVGAEEITNVTADSELEAADIQLDSPTLYKESTQQDIDIKAGGALDIESAGPGILQTPTNITKESPANLEMAAMLDNNTVNRQENYILKLNLDLLKDVMVEGGKTDMNVADLAFYGMGGTMQAANIGVYGANIQLGATDQKAGLANLSITGLELDKGFKIKTMGAGGGSGYKGKHRKSGGGRGPKGPNGGKHRAGDKGGAKKPHADCKECIGRTGWSIGFDVGDERFSHTDFSLSGSFPIVWDRIYRSNFVANDHTGNLGPRWITPFTLFIEDTGDTLTYYSVAGRAIETPSLESGERRYDRSEEIEWNRPDVDTLVINQKHERYEKFCRIGSRYRLVSIADRIGNRIELEYGVDGNIYEIRNDSHTVNLEYDERRRIVRIYTTVSLDGMPAEKDLAWYEYSEQGDLIAATDAHQSVRRYNYQHHLITRYEDRTGCGVNLEWSGIEPSSRCVREFADDGSMETVLSWDAEEPITRVTDSLGHTTTYRFDENNYISHIYFPDGTLEQRVRDEFHNIVTLVNRDGLEDRFEYDQRDNIIRHTRRDGAQVTWVYDENEQPIKVTDPLGSTWRRQYDQRQLLVLETDPLGRTTTYTYNNVGLPIAVKDAKGGVSRFVYSPSHKLLQFTDCSNNSSRWEYDDWDRAASATDAEGRTTQYQYDKRGNLERVTLPDGEQRILAYDAEGRLLSGTDAVGNRTSFEYDRMGRIRKRTDALNHSLEYHYNRAGQLTRFTNENNESYAFTFDPFGRLNQERGFDGKITQYTYTKTTGRLASVTEEGVTTRYEYDLIGNLVGRYCDGVQENFEYDAGDRLVRAYNRVSENRFQYDAVGNMVEVHQSYGLFGGQRDFVWRHEYDSVDNRTVTIRPDGVRTDWLIAGKGYVHDLLLNQRSVASFTLDRTYQEKSRILLNDLEQRSEYDPAGRIKSQVLVAGRFHERTKLRRDYHYDKIGQLVERVDSRHGAATFRYDPIGRIMRSTTPEFEEVFAFDPAHNIVDTTGYGREETTLPDHVSPVLGNLLKAYAGTHYEYDQRGNLARKSKPELVQQFSWDGFGRLERARSRYRDGRSIQARYFYDPFGRRIAKEIIEAGERGSTSRILFGWDGENLAFETLENDSQSTHYLYEFDSFIPLASYRSAFSRPDANGFAQSPVADIKFYHCDHIGTPREITDENQNIIWETSYRFWGHEWQGTHDATAPSALSQGNAFRFQGQYFDSETGLHYNRYRYYDPDSGRFIRQDPIGLIGGVNLYLYAPNATMWIDPFGLAPWPPGSFDNWFNSATLEQIREHMANPKDRNAIKNALRGSGGKHEWFPVSMAAKAKELGLNAQTLKSWATPTVDVYFQNINDNGNIIQGPHPSRNTSGCRASTVAHQQLMQQLNSATSADDALATIKNFARKFARNGGKQTGGFSVLS